MTQKQAFAKALLILMHAIIKLEKNAILIVKFKASNGTSSDVLKMTSNCQTGKRERNKAKSQQRNAKRKMHFR